MVFCCRLKWKTAYFYVKYILMNPGYPGTNTQFLTGGGEMGALIRSKDWSKTSIGKPEGWPQSLHTALSLVVHAKFPMLLLWGKALIYFYNDAYCASLRRREKHPEILGKPAGQAWPELWVIIQPIIEQVLLGGEATINQTQLASFFSHNAAEAAHWNFSFSPILDERGTREAVLIIGHESTFQPPTGALIDEGRHQLKKINEELKKSEERYHLMVDEVQDYAILYLNREGIIENWNKGAEKIKGYTAQEIIGKNFQVFYTEEDKKNKLPQKLLQEAATLGKATYEGWRVRKDGSLFWGNIVLTALHDEQKNVIGFSKVTRDLTDKKEADDKIKINAEHLEQKNKELEKMNAELESFAYLSSHDLQEPLRKIQTFASLIAEKELQRLSENGMGYFRRMESAAKRMQLLINDLLSYSRTSTAVSTFVHMDLREIIAEVKNELKETLEEKNGIIESEGDCKVNVIAYQFHQLMLNLIGNSIKFSKPGIPPLIQLKSEIVSSEEAGVLDLLPRKLYCHFTVTDNGIGFEPIYADRIFQVFQRLHGKGQYEGTGIGLAIVKKIVDNHHGVIRATGEPGKGARFDIYFPA
jgi:PAS domain S-box-containing protein